jgi:hypothetical protein
MKRKINKKGWIKVAESFISVMLLTSILFLIAAETKTKDSSSKFFDEKEFQILKGIQNNDTLRNEIINFENYELTSNSDEFPNKLKEYIDNNQIRGLNCTLGICEKNANCYWYIDSKKEAYAKKIVISSTLNIYNPKIIKLSCEKL